MTAPALDRFADALTVARPATAFFAALDDADRRAAEREDLEWRASFAPPVRSGGFCPCGSRFETRTERLELTDDERTQALSDIADLFGRGPLDALDDRIVDCLVAAINRAREDADYQAMADWSDAHAYCGDDL